MFRFYSWFCTDESLLAVLGDYMEYLEIKSGLTTRQIPNPLYYIIGYFNILSATSNVSQRDLTQEYKKWFSIYKSIILIYHVKMKDKSHMNIFTYAEKAHDKKSTTLVVCGALWNL